MSDPIERQAAINEIQRFLGYIDQDMIDRIKIRLRKLPTIEAEPVKHGRWELVQEHSCWSIFKCSHCGELYSFSHPFGEPKASALYECCPSCGAILDEKEEAVEAWNRRAEEGEEA